MSKNYDPSTITTMTVSYMVETTGDRWFIPTTGYGDNSNSGTTAQQLTQCQALSPFGEEQVTS